jgi:2-keto-4-pentenoate hydratase
VLDSATIDALARAYHRAEQDKVQVRPPSARHAGFPVEDACAVQRRWVEIKVAAAVLNHPANGVAWLASKLAPFDTALEPGQFVLEGPFTGMVDARAGDSFHTDHGPFGSVSARFA